MEFRLRDALPSAQREFGREVTLAGRDGILAGDERQMKPIGDESLFKEGPYTGKGENRPRRNKCGGVVEAPPGTPSMEELTTLGMAVREGFEDVVMLREVFRIDRGTVGMSEEDRRAYEQEAEE